jgi:hypothetical protein
MDGFVLACMLYAYIGPIGPIPGIPNGPMNCLIGSSLGIDRRPENVGWAVRFHSPGCAVDHAGLSYLLIFSVGSGRPAC